GCPLGESKMEMEDADRLAALLNQICSATIEALQAGDLVGRLEVAASLRAFYEQFDEESSIAPFVMLLAEWLEGQRPTRAAMRPLDAPFQRALETMLQQVPETDAVVGQEAEGSREPISRHVVAQLMSTVIAATASENGKLQRELAAQLVNIQMKLAEEWRERLGPLLENLRAILGGADPAALPAVPDPVYGRLWESTVELLLSGDLREESAHEQLMTRLVHNTLFVAQAGNSELTEGFLRSLLDVQRQALESGATGVATLVGAIRAHLQGLDAIPFASLLEGEELEAWLEILARVEGKETE
ncbi:MAG: hypothetical protein ACRDIB_06490, partial [Ardenticatenaceae bacterium]